MNTASLTRLAMATAALMLGHQVASKALRDAAFLAVWPTTSLPVMMMATAGLAVAMVPVFARLLSRFPPARVVFWGFLVSAAGHLVEWRLSARQPWVVVVLYLHIGGFAALLLSGFWSIVGERFDPRAARRAFGRIAAAGTVGGVLGSVAADRTAALFSTDAVLGLLAILHVLCAIGLAWIGRVPVLLPSREEDASGSAWQSLRGSAHIRAIATLMVLTTAVAAILDYLLKWRATSELGTGPELLGFFAVFYGGIHVFSFAAQAATVGTVRRFGIGRTITSLPAGVGIGGAVALLAPAFPVVVGLRGVETVLRSSLFRSGYELLFVPMDAAERRRVKTFLDVTCDRLGEAAGAGLVQVLLLAGVAYLTTELLAVAMLLAAASWWIGRRIDRLYLGVVERQLVKQDEGEPLLLGSETGWTVINLSVPAAGAVGEVSQVDAPAPRPLDPRLQVLADLRSGDRSRVEAALRRVSTSERVQVAQVVELLAWDDVVGGARDVLERAAPSHLGMLVDALVDPQTDFAIRRRLPRLLAVVGTQLAVDGLMRGLQDARFEVRYQCSRALDRMLVRNQSLAIDIRRIMDLVDREVSVPVGVWQGYGLIDQPEADDAGDVPGVIASDRRNIEHVFSLLATILPREPLQVALRGIQSSNPGLQGLAIEYLDQVLPRHILAKLRKLIEAPGPAASPVAVAAVAGIHDVLPADVQRVEPGAGRTPDVEPRSRPPGATKS